MFSLTRVVVLTNEFDKIRKRHRNNDLYKKMLIIIGHGILIE